MKCKCNFTILFKLFFFESRVSYSDGNPEQGPKSSQLNINEQIALTQATTMIRSIPQQFNQSYSINTMKDNKITWIDSEKLHSFCDKRTLVDKDLQMIQLQQMHGRKRMKPGNTNYSQFKMLHETKS